MSLISQHQEESMKLFDEQFLVSYKEMWGGKSMAHEGTLITPDDVKRFLLSRDTALIEKVREWAIQHRFEISDQDGIEFYDAVDLKLLLEFLSDKQ